jgi:serine/threonine-protein kinase 24/25/MST4|tara:strand:- start:2925 stop:4547 length:1623 start_codon:yes stop_codon:yes gene_type:complete
MSAPRSPDAPMIDDRYVLLAKVGRGATGEVYKARDVRTDATVAVKLVDLEDAEDDVADIQREISTLAQCASPYVTKYLASALVRGTSKLAIVMEYMAGGSARHLADEAAKGEGETTAIEDEAKVGLEEGEISYITRDVLRALEYLHEEGKIHRDVKAANVLLTEGGEARLADFGVSGQMTHTLGARRKTFTGTPFWMAPEVIQGGEGYDEKADIWSLGITCYELALGAAPHADLHPMRVLFVIPKNDAPRLPDDGRFSADFQDFVAKCLQKDAKARPSARELLNHPFAKQFDGAAVDTLKARVEKHISLTEGDASQASGAETALAQKQTSKAAPTWDFGEDSLGRKFSKQQLEQQQAQTQDVEIASDHGGSSIYQSMGGTIRMASRPSMEGTDDDADASSMGTATVGTESSRGAQTRYKLDDILDSGTVYTPLMQSLIAPAFERVQTSNDAGAAAALAAAEALDKLEIVSPGSLASFVQAVMYELSTSQDESMRGLKSRASKLFGGTSEDSVAVSNGGRSVVANYLLQRWQADVRKQAQK